MVGNHVKDMSKTIQTLVTQVGIILTVGFNSTKIKTTLQPFLENPTLFFRCTISGRHQSSRTCVLSSLRCKFQHHLYLVQSCPNDFHIQETFMKAISIMVDHSGCSQLPRNPHIVMASQGKGLGTDPRSIFLPGDSGVLLPSGCTLGRRVPSSPYRVPALIHIGLLYGSANLVTQVDNLLSL